MLIFPGYTSFPSLKTKHLWQKNSCHACHDVTLYGEWREDKEIGLVYFLTKFHIQEKINIPKECYRLNKLRIFHRC